MTPAAKSKALTKALYNAATRGDKVNLEKALADGAKPDARPPQCPTPLMAAAKAGHIEIIRKLVASGADVNFRHGSKRHGQTALTVAIESEQLESARALVALGADVNFGNEKNYLNQINTCFSDAAHWCIETYEGAHRTTIRGARKKVKSQDSGGLLTLMHEMLEAGATIRPGIIADAARWGHLALVDLLLKYGADINEDLRGNTAFSEVATWREADEMAAELLKRGADPYGGSETCGTPFHQAVASGRKHIVQAAIEAGRDLNRKSSTTLPSFVSETEAKPFEDQKEPDGAAHVMLWDRPIAHDATPIIVAVRCGNAELVRILAKGGVDLELTDRDGLTPLAWAIKLNRLDIAEVLRTEGAPEPANLEGAPFRRLMKAIDAGDLVKARGAIADGADVNGWDMDFQQHTTPLMKAASIGNAAIVSELLRAGADPNKAGREGMFEYGTTPLMLAARQGNAQVVEALLAAGADVQTRQAGAMDDARDRKRGSTALHEAAVKGHAKIVELLLRAGAKVNLASKSRGSPLVAAAESGDAETLQIVLHAGGRSNARPGILTGSPLMAAAFQNDQTAARTLLQAGADINAEARDGSTALIAAAGEGHTGMVQLLLSSGAKTEPKEMHPLQTALSACAREGHTQTAAVLLQAGANVNARCFDGTTPLHAAVLGQRADMVEMLLKAGADRSVKDEDGHTPLRFARNMLEMYVDKPNPAWKALGFRASEQQAATCRDIVRLLAAKAK